MASWNKEVSDTEKCSSLNKLKNTNNKTYIPPYDIRTIYDKKEEKEALTLFKYDKKYNSIKDLFNLRSKQSDGFIIAISSNFGPVIGCCISFIIDDNIGIIAKCVVCNEFIETTLKEQLLEEAVKYLAPRGVFMNILQSCNIETKLLPYTSTWTINEYYMNLTKLKPFSVNRLFLDKCDIFHGKLVPYLTHNKMLDNRFFFNNFKIQTICFNIRKKKKNYCYLSKYYPYWILGPMFADNINFARSLLNSVVNYLVRSPSHQTGEIYAYCPIELPDDNFKKLLEDIGFIETKMVYQQKFSEWIMIQNRKKSEIELCFI